MSLERTIQVGINSFQGVKRKTKDKEDAGVHCLGVWQRNQETDKTRVTMKSYGKT